MRLNDLCGKKFGKLTVLKRVESKVFPSGQKQTQYLCKCNCGKSITVMYRNLMSGNTKSCGCYAIELRTKHNLCGSKVYKCWDNMKSRCFNQNSTGYKSWGGRGITMCDEWRNDFKSFYDYVSKLPHFNEDGYSLDRIDNDGNYEPNNVRWATAKEQARNQTRYYERLGGDE